jgi:hypothetical protein
MLLPLARRGFHGGRFGVLLARLGGTLLLVIGFCLGIAPPASGEASDPDPAATGLVFLEYV